MLKKPLFWIIVVVAATVLWFIFAGHNKRNPSEMLSSRLPANHSEITGIPSNTELTASNQASNDNNPSTNQVVATQNNPSASEPNDSGALSDKQSTPSASADDQDDSSASADSQDDSNPTNPSSQSS